MAHRVQYTQGRPTCMGSDLIGHDHELRDQLVARGCLGCVWRGADLRLIQMSIPHPDFAPRRVYRIRPIDRAPFLPLPSSLMTEPGMSSGSMMGNLLGKNPATVLCDIMQEILGMHLLRQRVFWLWWVQH